MAGFSKGVARLDLEVSCRIVIESPVTWELTQPIAHLFYHLCDGGGATEALTAL